MCWQLHGRCQSPAVTQARPSTLPVPQVSRGAASLALHDHAQVHRAATQRRALHCTDRLLFARAADDSSSTASIDGLINLESAIPQKRAQAEQRASALGGLTAVVASVTAPAGGCSPRARVAPHGRAVTETFVRVWSVHLWRAASCAVRPQSAALCFTSCSRAPYTGYTAGRLQDISYHASCARHDERTSTASRRPCNVLWVR